MAIHDALVLSDLHLGWRVCEPAHRELLAHLPAAVGDAPTIIFNGDIVDAHRDPAAASHDLVAELVALCEMWRAEGRTVVVIEGNHDPDVSPLGPSVWRHELAGAHGERILILHGHRFDDAPYAYGIYERWGRHALARENLIYERAAMRRLYRFGPGWIVGAWGLTEDRLWRPKFPARVAPLLDGIDTLVHGHFHFGPGCTKIAGRPAWRSGAWVARGHLGTVDRMLRYRAGRWERIGIERGRVRAFDDGR